MSLDNFNAGSDGLEEYVEKQVCGEKHPRKTGTQCFLPAGHGTVYVGGLEFEHYDERNEVAWRSSRGLQVGGYVL